MEVRRVTPGEWEELRDIRLASLLDTPDAFGGTYAVSVLRDETWWRDWAKRTAESETDAMFLAWDGGKPVGIVGTFNDAGESVVIAMWAAPAHRGRGLGRALLDAVVSFIRAQGAREVVLGVTDGNDAARALYERYGFAFNGVANPLREGESLIVREMTLRL
jgi:ribosomal protein S18 acetylase RimI-like enzyme